LDIGDGAPMTSNTGSSGSRPAATFSAIERLRSNWNWVS
jgi:hypothetical protein